MTPQEQDMLNGLIGRVQQTQLAGKDPEADQAIQQALGRDPNALYVLCQTVLVQGYALEQATKQLNDAKAQLVDAQTKAQAHPGFLEKIFGSSQASPQPAAQQQAQMPPQGAPGYGGPVYGGAPQYGQPAYPPPPVYAQPGYGYAPQGGFGGGFGGGGFLQGAMQTAAGVAMGEIAFQGIEDLMHGFGHSAGYGSDRAMGFEDSGDRGSFGGDAGRDSGDNFGDRLRDADGGGNGLSPDIEDRRGDAHGFLGGDSDGGQGTGRFADDSATDQGYDGDNSTTDDTDSNDDSGSYDSGSDDSGSGDFGGSDDGN